MTILSFMEVRNNGSDTIEAEREKQKIKNSKGTDKINEYSQKADEATASTSRLSRIGGMVGKAIGSIATFGKNAAKSLTGAKKSSSGFGLSLGTLVKYGFGIRSLYVLVNKLRSALVDGFKNLSQYSGETNGSISMLWSSLERLKNSLATAFAPILTVVAPILSKFIDMLFYTGIDWKNLGSKFAEGVNGVVYEVDWAKLGQFIGHKLLALPTVIVGFIENLDWSALSKAASTLVLNFLDTLIEFIHNIDWSKIVTNIQDALTNIQWIAIAEKILELLGYALGSITGAQGAVIPPNKEFMAVLGDQKSGNNIEAPESLIRRIVREESGNGKGSTYNVTAQVNRRTLFDLVLEEGKVRRTVTGRNPFETV